MGVEVVLVCALRLVADCYVRGVYPQNVVAALNREGYDEARETLDHAFGALSPGPPPDSKVK
jgi:hypothetical protein